MQILGYHFNKLSIWNTYHEFPIMIAAIYLHNEIIESPAINKRVKPILVVSRVNKFRKTMFGQEMHYFNTYTL